MGEGTTGKVQAAAPTVVERGPDGRYLRYDTILGKGAFKTVYKGFDEREGIEVAWNQVKSHDFIKEGHKLTQEINVLKNMKHKNVMCFYDSWIDEESGTVNFITELFTSGTLRQYRQKHKNLGKNALKRLETSGSPRSDVALQLLKVASVRSLGNLDGYSMAPGKPIVLGSTLGRVQIPQLGTGTPEFMAPELYDERYDEKVDVYGFGMCMLELATMQYPYSECVNAAQIYKRVSQGRYPDGLKLVEDDELREFIELCISHLPDARPDTRRLLKHSFFEDIRKSAEKEREQEKLGDNSERPRDLSPSGSTLSHSISSRSEGGISAQSEVGPLVSHPSSPQLVPAVSAIAQDEAAVNSVVPRYAAADVGKHGHTAFVSELTAGPPGGGIEQVFVKAEPAATTDASDHAIESSRVVSMEVGNLPQRDGETCNIEFAFELGVDNVQDIINEMQTELNLDLAAEEATIIQKKIDEELQKARELLEQQGVSSGLLPDGLLLDMEADYGVQIVNAPEAGVVSTSKAPCIHDAHRSAFERATKTDESRQSQISNVHASGSAGHVSEMGGSGSAHGVGWPVNGRTSSPTEVLPSANGVQKSSANRISPSPSWAEQRENGSGDPSGPQLARVETFSEVRKRFEEAHAAGLLHESTAC